MNEKLLRSGAFAKLCGIEKHVLFHYDSINLLSPVFVDHNQYRYYSLQQYDTFRMIHMLKKLGMSLEDIKAFIHQRTPDQFLTLLEEKQESVYQQINELKNIQSMITQLKHHTTHALLHQFDPIQVVTLEEGYLWLSDNLKNKTSSATTGFAKAYSGFMHRHNLASGEFVSIMVQLDELKENNTNYSYYFYTPATKKDQHAFLQKKGTYLCGYHIGSYQHLNATYEQLFQYADEHHYIVGTHAYEEYLISDSAQSDENQYVTRIYMEITT